MPIAFLLFTLALLLGFVVVVMLPLGVAVDRKARSSTAADAAALAGAEAVRQHWVTVAAAPGGLAFPSTPALGPDVGRAEASAFAEAHGSRLVGYQVHADGSVRVQVADAGQSHGVHDRATSEASAAIAAPVHSCRWGNPLPPLVADDRTSPLSTPSPGSTDTERMPAGDDDGPADASPYPPGTRPDPRPATFERTLVCGGWRVPYVVDNRRGPRDGVWPVAGYSTDVSVDALYDSLEPRLIR